MYSEIDISSKLVQENESSDKPGFGFWIKSLLTIVIVEEIFHLFEFLFPIGDKIICGRDC